MFYCILLRLLSEACIINRFIEVSKFAKLKLKNHCVLTSSSCFCCTTSHNCLIVLSRLLAGLSGPISCKRNSTLGIDIAKLKLKKKNWGLLHMIHRQMLLLIIQILIKKKFQINHLLKLMQHRNHSFNHYLSKQG